jgi:putative ABC transport system permease protein
VLRLAWRGVRFNLGRYVATLVAILTGVAFFAGSGFLSDRVIDALEGDVNRQYGNVDAAIVVDTDGDAAQNAAERLRIGGETVDALAALPEVDAVAGDLTGSVAFLDGEGEVRADSAVGRLWITDEALNPLRVIDGAAPAAANEIAVDRKLAADEDLSVGQSVTMLTLAGPTDVTITGITRFGDADGLDAGGTVSLPESSAFDLLNRGQVEYVELYLRGSGSASELVAAAEPLVPAGFVAKTGDEFRDDKRSQVAGIGSVLKRVLQFFALLALVVGGFVIYNTFNVIVAQRTRELAVLAAIGATPTQLKRSLRWEALVIGFIGSALGVVAGFGMAFGLMAVLERLGVSLPGSGVAVRTGTVVQAMLFGTIITFLSVMLPARRAGKAEPMEALRQADLSTVAVGKVRTVLALVLVGGGAAAMLTATDGRLIGVAAVALFVGVIMAGPLIAVVGSFLLRPILGRFGLEGRLAADNTARNPQRTATTSNALLIGVFLVTFVSVAGTSAKDYAVDQINELSTADYTISSNGGTIDDALIEQLESVPGVELVTPFRREAVALTVDGEDRGSTNLSTGDLEAITTAAGIDLKEGSLDDLVPGTVLLLESQAPNAAVGSTAVFQNSVGEDVELEVVGIVGLSLDAMLTGAITDAATFDAFVGETAPTVAFIKTVSGAQSDTEDGIEAITKLRPDISLQAGNFVGRLIGTIFDFLINAVNGLLLMSVVIALIGIVNTMTLSIIERRRELGLLRVVGMLDRRVRRMVRIESVVIAALGTVSGMLLGVFSGIALISAIDRLSDADISISLPPILLGVVLVLGLALGLIAALIPAQRSTRLDVLEAIQAT